ALGAPPPHPEECSEGARLEGWRRPCFETPTSPFGQGALLSMRPIEGGDLVAPGRLRGHARFPHLVRTAVATAQSILYSRLRGAGGSGRIALEETHGRRIARGVCDYWHRRLVLHPGGVGRAKRERSRRPH